MPAAAARSGRYAPVAGSALRRSACSSARAGEDAAQYPPRVNSATLRGNLRTGAYGNGVVLPGGTRMTRESVTATLADFVTGSGPDDVPAPIRDEAKRAILNYLGCALGGSVEPALDTAIRMLAPYSGPADAAVLGRRERFDVPTAALPNG